MPRIIIKTAINAPLHIVFDLSRSIDLHTISVSQTKETAIAGVTSGLIGLHDSVTWRAKHFGLYHTLTSKITAFNAPHSFVDEMTKGPFKTMRHEHHFEYQNKTTIMTDIFEYRSPLGVMGRLADVLFLKRYMQTFLEQRNAILKHYAESNNWQQVLEIAHKA